MRAEWKQTVIGRRPIRTRVKPETFTHYHVPYEAWQRAYDAEIKPSVMDELAYMLLQASAPNMVIAACNTSKKLELAHTPVLARAGKLFDRLSLDDQATAIQYKLSRD